MTELQSPQRKSYTTKTIFGLLLAVVMVAAFATAGSASPPSGGQLTITKECSQFSGQPGGFCTITSSNVPGIDSPTQVVYTDPTFVGHVLRSHLYIEGSDGNPYGYVVLQVPVPGGIPDHNDSTGRLTFSGGTGSFSGFHATVFVDCRPSGSPCTWDGTYNFTHVSKPTVVTTTTGLGRVRPSQATWLSVRSNVRGR